MLKTRPIQMMPNRIMNTNGSTSATSAISAPSVLLSPRAVGLKFLIRLAHVGTPDARSFYPLRRDQPHRHRGRAVAKNNWRSRGLGSATDKVDDRSFHMAGSRR